MSLYLISPTQVPCVGEISLEAAELYDGVVPLTQEDLAGFVGATRVSVNRVLADLEKRGAIKIGRRNLLLKDHAILQHDIRY